MEVLVGKKRAFGAVLANGRAVTVELTPVLVFQNNPGQKLFFHSSHVMLFLSAVYLVIGCIFSPCNNFLLIGGAAQLLRITAKSGSESV